MTSNNSSSRNNAPKHVAIVMDGNGRWAQSQGKSRIFGHQAGVEIVRKIVRYAAQCDTKHLTLYSFSTENWKRPKEEVQALFGLLKTFVKRDLEQLHKENVRVTVLGNKQNLPKDIQSLLEEVESKTKSNLGLCLNIAFNYGGRDEIVRMVRQITKKIIIGSLSQMDITEQVVSEHMDTKGQPDPDIIIRTGGENRLSNFLLWQSAYAEFVLLDVLWPDFTSKDYEEALDIYCARQRRLGGTSC